MKKILLFQNYLRKHILNFGLFLDNFEFIHKPDNPHAAPTKTQKAATLEALFKIKKTNWLIYIRRILGIPNIRIRLGIKEDLAFTYGCLLISNKPYITYVENGLAFFNYDLHIAKNPLARFIFGRAVKMKNCKKIIFMSQAAEKSFFSTLKLKHSVKEVIRQKSIQCYPLIINPLPEVKAKTITNTNGLVKFLFTGTFYIKGGLEIINVFSRLRKKYSNIQLTIISDKGIKPDDLKKIKNTPGIKLLEAKFSEKEMFENFFNTHDIFLMPTFRDSFCLVLVEALSASMPIIANDQFATKEMIRNNYNGFLFPDHPLRDYNSETYEMYGKLSEPADFFSLLFKLQANGATKPVENFLYDAMEKFILNPSLIEKFSKNSLELYNNKFHYQLISKKIESIFLEALKK